MNNNIYMKPNHKNQVRKDKVEKGQKGKGWKTKLGLVLAGLAGSAGLANAYAWKKMLGKK